LNPDSSIQVRWDRPKESREILLRLDPFIALDNTIRIDTILMTAGS
jgi:hypothetical protein